MARSHTIKFSSRTIPLIKPNPPPVQPASPDSGKRRKIALCMGIEYRDYDERNVDQRLPGCHRDARNMTAEMRKLGYTVRTLTDERSSGPQPDRKTILAELETLARQSGNADIVVTYAGHGSQKRDHGGDERDGNDETLVPSDYKSAGQITDDEIHAHFISKLDRTATFNGIFDCCHSGTICDLERLYGFDGRSAREIPGATRKTKSTPCECVTLSGCRDDQVSMSAFNIEGRGLWQGAMTWAFTTALDQLGPSPKWTDILEKVHYNLTHSHYEQKPRLASSTDVSGLVFE